MPLTPSRFASRTISLLLSGLLVFSPAIPAQAFSLGDEIKAGEQIQATVHQEFTILDDPDIDQYISRLGREILSVAGPQYFDYRFYVVKDRDFNAFAAPSGLVFVNSGLVETMDNENELVGVMAHEIGHVVRRHIADRVDKGSKIGIGTAALILAGIALGGGELSEAVITGAMATGTAMNLKFSRENEEEADRQAFSWMVQLGRDPHDILTMLNKMRRISILKTGKIPPYLLTHPAPEQRIDYIQDLLQSSGTGESAKTPDNFRFARIKYRIMVSTRDTTALLPILLKKAKSTDEEGKMARYGLALIYQQDGNFAKSRQYFQELLAGYPDQPILKTDLGLGYIREGKPAEALKLFSAAHLADPADAYTIFHLARTLEDSGQTSQAIELYQTMLNLTPTYARLNFYLGRALAATGHADQGYYYNGVSNWLEGNLTAASYHLQKAIDTLPAKDSLSEKSRDLLVKIKQLEKM
jgi:predicted Zn-dependent protease